MPSEVMGLDNINQKQQTKSVMTYKLSNINSDFSTFRTIKLGENPQIPQMFVSNQNICIYLNFSQIFESLTDFCTSTTVEI